MVNKKVDEYNLEKIYNRLDTLSIFIEKSLSEIDDINEIRSIVEELRANLLKTIDERVEYIMEKQKDIYEMKLYQIEKDINNISNSNIKDINDLKEKALSNINQMKLEIESGIKITNGKIDSHLADKINFKQLIVPSIITTLVGIVIVIAVAILDKICGFGIRNLLDKFK